MVISLGYPVTGPPLWVSCGTLSSSGGKGTWNGCDDIAHLVVAHTHRGTSSFTAHSPVPWLHIVIHCDSRGIHLARLASRRDS